MSILRGRVDEIDVQINKIHKLIEGASIGDPELAAGFATTESLGGVQRKVDQCAAACEDLESNVKDALRNRGK